MCSWAPNNFLLIYKLLSTRIIVGFFAIAFLTGCASTLRDTASAHQLLIGSAAAKQPLLSDSEYRKILSSEFSMMTPENALKFDSLHPEPKVFNFAAADEMIEFASDNDMLVRGHTLIWNSQLPSWIEDKRWSKEAIQTFFADHIKIVVGHYRGVIPFWDVVNEAFKHNGSYKKSLWLDAFGEEYIALAFIHAHKADPSAKLFYNDYSIADLSPKSDAVFNMVKRFKEDGIPIHGIGFQMHFALNRPPRMEEVAKNFERFADLGIEIHITELDIRIDEPFEPGDFEKQAEFYRSILQICLDQKWCTGFSTWGFTDRYSWIPQFFPGTGAALLWDELYRKKPSYFALKEELEITEIN